MLRRQRTVFPSSENLFHLRHTHNQSSSDSSLLFSSCLAFFNIRHESYFNSSYAPPLHTSSASPNRKYKRKYDVATGRISSQRYEAAKVLRERNYRLSEHDPQEIEGRRARAVNERIQGTRQLFNDDLQQQNRTNEESQGEMNDHSQSEFDRFYNALSPAERSKVQKKQGARSMQRDYDVDAEPAEPSDDVTKNKYHEDDLHNQAIVSLRYRQQLPSNYYSEKVRTPDLDGIPGEWMRRSRSHQPGHEVFRALTTGETLGTEFDEVQNFGGAAKLRSDVKITNSAAERFQPRTGRSTSEALNNSKSDEVEGEYAEKDDLIPPIPVSKMQPPVYDSVLELPKLKSFTPRQTLSSKSPFNIISSGREAQQCHKEERQNHNENDDYNGGGNENADELDSSSFEERQQLELALTMRRARPQQQQLQQQQTVREIDDSSESENNNVVHRFSDHDDKTSHASKPPPVTSSINKNVGDPQLQFLMQFTRAAIAPSQEAIALLARELASELLLLTTTQSSDTTSLKNNSNSNQNNNHNSNHKSARASSEGDDERSAMIWSPLIVKLRRTARIASQYGAWEGALGLMTALRVAPFVEVAAASAHSQMTSTATSSSSSLSSKATMSDENDGSDNEQAATFRRLIDSPDCFCSSSSSFTSPVRERNIIRNDFVSANYAVALAVAQAAQHSMSMRRKRNTTQPHEETGGENSDENHHHPAEQKSQEYENNNNVSSPLHTSPAITIARIAKMTDLATMTTPTTTASDQEEATSNSDRVHVQLSAVSSFCTNYIVSCACRLTSMVSPKRDPEQWMTALSVLQFLDIHQPSPSASLLLTSSSSLSPPSFSILNAVPYSFSSTARTLRNCGQFHRAIHLLETVYAKNILTKTDLLGGVLGVTDGKSEDDREWKKNSTPFQTLARMKVLMLPTASTASSSSSPSTPKSSIRHQVEEVIRLVSHLSSVSSSSSLQHNKQSFETALTCVRTLLWNLKRFNPQLLLDNELKTRVVDYLLHSNEKREILSSSSSSSIESLLINYTMNVIVKNCPSDSPESITSLASLLSISDVAVNELSICEDLIAFVQSKDSEREHHQQDQASSSSSSSSSSLYGANFNEEEISGETTGTSAYVQILNKTNLLAHPLVLSGLMKSCVRNSKFQLAIDLFEAVLPATNRIATSNPSCIPESLVDRRVSHESVDILAGAIWARSSGKNNKNINSNAARPASAADLWNVDRDDRENVEAQQEQNDVMVLRERIDALRAGLIRTIHSLMKRFARLSSNDFNPRNNRNNKFENEKHQARLVELSRTLSCFAPSLHERGVHECVVAYLAAIDELLSSSSSSSSTPKSSNTNNNNSNKDTHNKLNKSEIITSLLSSVIPQSSWRNVFLPQLFQLLYHHGMHGKVSSIYHSIQQASSAFLDEDYLVGGNGEEDGEDSESRANKNGNKTNHSNHRSALALDPASVDFETLKLAQRQERKDKLKSRDEIKRQHRFERAAQRGRPDLNPSSSNSNTNNNPYHSSPSSHRHPRGSNSSSSLSLPVVLDSKSLCFVIHSLCECGHYRLATKIAEDEVLGGQEVIRRMMLKQRRMKMIATQSTNDDDDNEDNNNNDRVDGAMLIKRTMLENVLTLEQEREVSLTGDFAVDNQSVLHRENEGQEEDDSIAQQVDFAVMKVKSGLMMMTTSSN